MSKLRIYKNEKTAKGIETYREYSDGFWTKQRYNKQGQETYVENSDDYWEKTRYGDETTLSN